MAGQAAVALRQQTAAAEEVAAEGLSWLAAAELKLELELQLKFAWAPAKVLAAARAEEEVQQQRLKAMAFKQQVCSLRPRRCRRGSI
jgi:hypothetical protein